MTDPYVKRDAGDIISASDWNEAQIKARTQIETHTHQGGEQGPQLTGAAVDPATTLTVAALEVTGELSVNTRKVLAEIDAITGRLAGFVAKAGDTMTGQLAANGGIALNGSEIRLRGNSDRGHGLGWFGDSTQFAGRKIDGAVLWGWNGGFLGTAAGGERVALEWDNNGNVRSPKWHVTQVMNNVNGDHVSQPVTFTSGGGTLLILCSGSGRGGTFLIGMNVRLDNQVIGTMQVWNNAASNHIPFISYPIVRQNVASGNHTLSLEKWPTTVIDSNDYYNIVVIEFPF